MEKLIKKGVITIEGIRGRLNHPVNCTLELYDSYLKVSPNPIEEDITPLIINHNSIHEVSTYSYLRAMFWTIRYSDITGLKITFSYKNSDRMLYIFPSQKLWGWSIIRERNEWIKAFQSVNISLKLNRFYRFDWLWIHIIYVIVGSAILLFYFLLKRIFL